MSSPNTDTAVQPIDNTDSPARTEDPVSFPERQLIKGDIPNPTTTQQQWNGDSMDWKSWPTGRPGPLVSEAAMRRAMNLFHACDSRRDERSRTEERCSMLPSFLQLVGVSSMSIDGIWSNPSRNICRACHGTGAGYSVRSEYIVGPPCLHACLPSNPSSETALGDLFQTTVSKSDGPAPLSQSH